MKKKLRLSEGKMPGPPFPARPAAGGMTPFGLAGLWLVAGLWIVAGLTACRKQAAPTASGLPSPPIAAADLREGDLVFRRGTSLESRAVMSQGGVYSHIGIAARDSSGRMGIIHAVPGEATAEGDSDCVKFDLPADFFRADRAVAGAVRRLQGDSLLPQRAAEEARRILRRRPLFDHDYDEGDTSRLYCTELVSLCYRRAGRDIAGKERSFVRLPGLRGYYLLPVHLWKAEGFRPVVDY